MKCAVVGVGYLGTFHAQKYKNNSEVELVGVYDAYPEQAQKVAQSLGVKVFNNLDEMKNQVDAVTIAASTKSHFELAQFFLTNKIAVNVEKPMTATLSEAEKLVEIAESMNVPLSVGHIERFNPSILDLKKHINKPSHIEFKRQASFKSRGADVSVIYDLMIHDLDLALWLTDSEPDSWIVSGTRLISREWDTCQVAMKMKNGIAVNIDVSRVSANPVRSIQVTQTSSILFANTGTLEISEVTAGPGGMNSSEPMLVKKWTVDKKDALQEETNAFIHAVKNKKPMPVSARDGLRAMKWIAEIEKDLAKKL